MGKFSEYVAEQETDELAAFLLLNDIDVDKFCETVIQIIDDEGLITETQLLQELGLRNVLGGVSNAAVGAAGLAGLGNMAAGPARQAAGSLGNAARSLAGAAKTAWANTGGKAITSAGQYMSQSAQAEKLRQAQNATLALQKQLEKFGYSPNALQKVLSPLMRQFEKDMEANKQLGFKIGQRSGQQPAQSTPPAPPTARSAPQAPPSRTTNAPQTQSAVSPEFSRQLDALLNRSSGQLKSNF